MRKFTVQQPNRKFTKLLVALSGASGNGKTYTALTLAKRMAGEDGKVVLIDTEGGRANIYADDPDVGGYLVVPFYPPFGVSDYKAAFDAARSVDGVKAIVFDGFSDVWDGEGGIIDRSDRVAFSKKDLFWAKEKRLLWNFVDDLNSSGVNVILCMQAKPTQLRCKDESGKEVRVEGPLQPIIEQRRTPGKFLLHFMLENDGTYTVLKAPKPLVPIVGDKGQNIKTRLNSDICQQICDWLGGDDGINPESIEAYKKAVGYADSADREGLRAYTSSLSKAGGQSWAYVKSRLDELQSRLSCAEEDESEQGDDSEDSVEQSPFG